MHSRSRIRKEWAINTKDPIRQGSTWFISLKEIVHENINETRWNKIQRPGYTMVSLFIWDKSLGPPNGPPFYAWLISLIGLLLLFLFHSPKISLQHAARNFLVYINLFTKVFVKFNFHSCKRLGLLLTLAVMRHGLFVHFGRSS